MTNPKEQHMMFYMNPVDVPNNPWQHMTNPKKHMMFYKNPVDVPNNPWQHMTNP